MYIVHTDPKSKYLDIFLPWYTPQIKLYNFWFMTDAPFFSRLELAVMY